MRLKTFLAAAVLLLVGGVASGTYYFFHKGDPVYYRILEEPAEALDAGRVAWMREKDRQKGVHLYSLETGNPYELLVYDNSHAGENLYRTSKLDAKLYDGTLRIDIIDSNAQDDSFVNDRLIAYFIIKEKPRSIEVYRNEKKEPFTVESGGEKISQ